MMNLMDVLLFQKQKELKKLLCGSNPEINVHSKREIVEFLIPLLMNVDEISNRMRGLSDEARTVLLALSCDEKLTYCNEELLCFVPRSTRSNYLLIYEELMNNGFLFSYVEKQMIVPIQLKQRIIKVFTRKLEEDLIAFPSRENENKLIPIVNDIFSFVEMLAEKPIPITVNGVIYKKDFNRIMDNFSYPENYPNEKWRFGYGRRFANYPDRFSLIYDFCYSKKWIKEEDGFLSVTNESEQLYDLKIYECISSLIQYWLKLYKRNIPIIPCLYKLLVSTIREEKGLDEEVIISMFSPFVEPYYYDDKQAIIRKRLLAMLVHLNVLQKIEVGQLYGYTTGVAKKMINESLE